MGTLLSCAAGFLESGRPDSLSPWPFSNRCTLVRAVVCTCPPCYHHEEEKRHCCSGAAFGRGPRITWYHPAGVSREDHPLRGITRRLTRKTKETGWNERLTRYTQFERNGLSQNDFLLELVVAYQGGCSQVLFSFVHLRLEKEILFVWEMSPLPH